MNNHIRIMLVLTTLVSAISGAGQNVVTDTLPGHWMLPQTDAYRMTLPADDSWWKSFNDPLLVSLVERGERNNYDVRMAVRRIEIAKARMGSTRAAYYPNIGVQGSWTAMQSSGRTGHQYAETQEVDYFSVGATMSWEIDVFGRVKAQLNAGKAAVNIARADRDAALVSMAANIGTTYVQLRLAQGRLDVARKQMDSQKQILHITEVRKETGLSSGLDVSQAKTVLLTTEASLPALDAQVRSSINSLAVLLGEYPATLSPQLTPVQPIPEAARDVAVGVPADLLRRRPDVAQAEAEVAQAAAQVGIAKKDWLPTLALSGSIGTSSSAFDKLFSSHSYAWQVAPEISWTVFDGFARKYENAAAKLELENSIDQYNQTLVSAYSDVENAMSAYTSALQQIEAEKLLLEQAEKTFTLSLDLYKQGLSQFSDVMNAQISWLNTENSLLAAKAQAASSLIELYQALGGGYTPAPQQ